MKKAIKFLLTSLLVMPLFVSAGCFAQGNTYETKLREYITQKLNENAKGIFQIVSLKKTDGYERSADGRKVYVLEYTLVLKATTMFYAYTENTLAEWTSSSLEAYIKRPSEYYPNSLEGRRIYHYAAGTTYGYNGQITLFKTEKEIRVVSFSFGKAHAIKTINPGYSDAPVSHITVGQSKVYFDSSASMPVEAEPVAPPKN